MTEEIAKLRSEISMLKEENDIKVNNLVKVHLKELEDLRNESHRMKNDLLASKDLFDVTLATMDKDLTKAKQSIKDYEEETATETAEWMKDLDNLRKELEIHRRKDCNECKDKTETNVYLKQLYKEFVHFMEGSTFKCKLCNKLLANNREVVNHTMSEHEAKKFMEKTFNMIVCLKTKH